MIGIRPARVDAAARMAESVGFTQSSNDQVGRLLAAIVASKPGGRFGEAGTGVGFGAAWIASAMTPGSTLITVEPDPRLAAAASTVLSGLPGVHVRRGDWRALADEAPYDVLFLDGGDSKWAIDECAAYLASGGIAVMDDLSPGPNWPEPFDDPEHGYRWAWAARSDVASVEVISGPPTTPGYPPFVALLAVRRTGTAFMSPIDAR